MSNTEQKIIQKIITSQTDNLENLEETYSRKRFKALDIILIDDEYSINYFIEDETSNIFPKKHIYIKCPFCSKKIREYLGLSGDADNLLNSGSYEPVAFESHLREAHNENFLAIKNKSFNKANNSIKFTLTKKIVL